MSKPSHSELEDQIADFLLKGGTINQVEEGQSAIAKQKAHERYGNDDYTDRSMRSAENQEDVESAYFGR